MAKDFKQFVGKANTQKNQGLGSLIRGNNADKKELTTVWLDNALVYSNPQVRTVFIDEDIEELAATMKGRKQRSAILVGPADADGRHCIFFGEQRWRAAKLNNEPVKAEIDPSLVHLSKAARISGQLVENIARSDLSPMDLALSLNELRVEGMSVNDIAATLGKKPPYISKHLKLVKAPDEITQLLSDKVVTYIETINILSDIYAINKDRALELVTLARAESGLSRDKAQVVLDELKGKTPKVPVVQQQPDTTGAGNEPQQGSNSVANTSITGADSDPLPGDNSPADADNSGAISDPKPAADSAADTGTSGADSEPQPAANSAADTGTSGADSEPQPATNSAADTGTSGADSEPQPAANSAADTDTTGADSEPQPAANSAADTDTTGADSEPQPAANSAADTDTTGADSEPQPAANSAADTGTSGADSAPQSAADSTQDTGANNNVAVIVTIDGEKWELLVDTAHVSKDDRGENIVSCKSLESGLVAEFPAGDCILHSITSR